MFPAEGGEAELVFKTNSQWSAMVDMRAKEWCRLTPKQGKAGEATLSVIVSENKTYAAREATLVVKAGEVSDTLFVKQEAQVKPECYLIVDEDSCTVEWQGGVMTVAVESNVEYVVTLPEVRWLRETHEYGGGVESGVHHFVVDANEAYEERRVEVIFANEAEGVADTLYVTQEAQVKPESYLRLHPDAHQVHCYGSVIAVSVETNVDYVVTAPEVDWLYETFEYGGGVENRHHHFRVSANDTYEERRVEVIFANEAEGVADTLYVTQEALVKPESYLRLHPAAHQVHCYGSVISVSVETNVDYVVTAPEVDWLYETFEYGGGMENRHHHFRVSANATYEERRVEVIFANEIEGVADTLYVTQEAQVKPESYLQLSMDTCEVRWSGQIIDVEVRTNVEYEVKMPNVKWVREAAGQGGSAGAGRHQFIVDKNDAYEERRVTIIFTNEAEEITDTLYIVQKGLDEKGGIEDMPEHPL